MIDVAAAVMFLGHPSLPWLINCGWVDRNCQLGWEQWNWYAASGEWV